MMRKRRTPKAAACASWRAAASKAVPVLMHHADVIRGRWIMSSKSWRVPLGGFLNSDKLRQCARYWRARD
jgi:hypothetical protein